MINDAGSAIRAAFHGIDAAWCRLSLAAVGDRPGLLSFLFHAVADDGDTDEIDRVVDPTQTLTVSSLTHFIRYFKTHGYEFVSPPQVYEGLNPDGRYVLMTFDDGYYNNHRALSVLMEEDVPAVFFISTNHIREQRAFWWDVVYRERLLQGTTVELIRAEQVMLKGRMHTQIEDYLLAEFGAQALEPKSHEDRPMTVEELRTFAKRPGVHIGNHTADHAILTNYSEGAVRAQIEVAQDALEGIVGSRPMMISYPNGNYSPAVLRISGECGLQLGVTVDARRSPIPTGDTERLSLGRYCFTRGHDDDRTYRGFRSSTSLKRLVRRASARVRDKRRA